MLRMRTLAVKALATLPLICAAAASTAVAEAQFAAGPLFLTATNGATNYLAVIDTRTHQTSYVPTGGSGGASGNAGGVAVNGGIAAVVNFGSSNVTIFLRFGGAMLPTQKIAVSSPPVSVAFGSGHLVVLGLTTAQSFPVYGDFVEPVADGQIGLLLADKSAAQIVTFDGGVAYTEKTGSVAEVTLAADGMRGLGLTNKAVALPAAPNNNTPFGLIGRGANIYLTIAHSDLESLVVNGKIVSTAEGPTPFTSQGNIIHAPCWNALYGQFLYAADSPGKQLLRYLVSDTNVFYDKPGVATLSGAPTDLAVDGNLLGVIDGGNGTTSDASLFTIDSEGELTLLFAVKIPGAINGAAIID